MARWGLALAGVALVVAAVATVLGSEDEETGLTVFAAASLRGVLADLEAAWLTEHPDEPLTLSTEASNVLAAQIAEGAPADVFLSADSVRPRELAEAGLTAAQPVPFATSRLALVVPAGSERISSAADLASPGVRIVGIGRGAPIAAYTTTAIAALSQPMPDPGAYRRTVEANIVSREDNVRAALAKVELGEGDAAFVYVTDALASDEVQRIPLPPGADVSADYAAVAISDEPRAAEFVAWLSGPVATSLLESAGFEVER